MEELRKVEFFIEKDPELGLFDASEEEHQEVKELARKRLGIFYGVTYISSILGLFENDEKMPILKFVIEDVETGLVHNVDPLNVEFKDKIFTLLKS